MKHQRILGALFLCLTLIGGIVAGRAHAAQSHMVAARGHLRSAREPAMPGRQGRPPRTGDRPGRQRHRRSRRGIEHADVSRGNGGQRRRNDGRTASSPLAYRIASTLRPAPRGLRAQSS
jgi:hypothetical protein